MLFASFCVYKAMMIDNFLAFKQRGNVLQIGCLSIYRKFKTNQQRYGKTQLYKLILIEWNLNK